MLFTARVTDTICQVRLREDFIKNTTKLYAKDVLLDYLETVSNNASIKVIAMMSNCKHASVREYLNYFHTIRYEADALNNIHRTCNFINQFIVHIKNLKKIVVYAASGHIIPMMLNIGLASDYCIITEDSVLENPYLKIGTLPIGGGIFFLSKLLPPAKIYEFLLSEDAIPAKAALELGIVAKIVPAKYLEDETLSVARKFAAKPPHMLSGIKRVVNYERKGLRDFLKLENDEFFKIINTAEFWENIN